MKKSDKKPTAPPKEIKKTPSPQILIPTLLVIVLIFALASKMDAVRNKPFNTYDESIYDYLGTQLKHEPFNYSPSKFYQSRAKQFTDPVERERFRRYVDVPLFKHPPLFCYLIAVSKTLCGDERIASSYVSLFFGIATIAIIYFLSKNLWGPPWGLVAAFFMAIEPVYWLCSQKIWIETTVGFFIYLGLLFLVMGEKAKGFLIVSGTSLGLALLCKYVAILAIIPIYLVLLFTNTISDRKMLALYVLLPFIVGLPWLAWNYKVYGSEWFVSLVKINSSSSVGTGGFNFILKFVLRAAVPALSLVLLLAIKCFLKRLSDTLSAIARRYFLSPLMRNISFAVAAALTLALVVLSRTWIVKSLAWTHLVKSVPSMGAFNNHPPYFYFYRLVEASLLFLFGYLSVAFFKKWNKWIFVLALIPVSLFSFFGLFGYYESRYVIIATPALMMLAAYSIRELTALFMGRPGWARTFIVPLILMLVLYAVAKTVYCDFSVMVKNNFVFF